MIFRKSLTAVCAVLCLSTSFVLGGEFFVSPQGDDANRGTKDSPFATLLRARDAVRKMRAENDVPMRVFLREGTYYLPETLVLDAADSGSADSRIVYSAYQNEQAVLSGGMKLELAWTPHKRGILQATVPKGFRTDQLFLEGQRQPMARYPNHNPAERIFGGYAADCFDVDRAARWSDPRGGFLHAMHRNMWGDFHYIITGKDDAGKITLEGGWQNNRRYGMHGKYRFVENIIEELDAPGEWFLDETACMLYLFPPEGVDPTKTLVEGVRLRHLIEFRGTQDTPVRFVTFRGLVFRHAARTFMLNREPLLRSDWTTYRGGAILFDGTEDCSLEDCFLDQLGGNALFVNKYNRRVTVRGCHIARAGANGIAFVGSPDAVRSPLFEYSERQTYEQIDKTPGPKTDEYPADCLVEDCLIERSGRVEKQTSPVQISMASRITVRHCSMYDVPRAGINISEGTWGGHLIEFCDVFDTVKETGDHGSFNSWGRDRFWGLKDINLDEITLDERRELPRLDMVEPIVLRNNRWRCDHGWDIDLDDGSSNYHVVNNLCLGGGIKHREGFYRVCENNIMVNNSFHPHVWYLNSQDTFRRNIVFTKYRPIRVRKPWGKECDFNLLHVRDQKEPTSAGVLQEQSGLDEHSLAGDARFVDPASGDYRVAEDSPAIGLGFKNFPMDQFGVQKPELRAIARTPHLPGNEKSSITLDTSKRNARVHDWLGAKVKNIVGLGEVSASGLPGEIGVLLVRVPKESRAAKAGLHEADVILKLNRKKTDTVQQLIQRHASFDEGESIELTVFRNQRALTLVVREK